MWLGHSTWPPDPRGRSTDPPHLQEEWPGEFSLVNGVAPRVFQVLPDDIGRVGAGLTEVATAGRGGPHETDQANQSPTKGDLKLGWDDRLERESQPGVTRLDELPLRWPVAAQHVVEATQDGIDPGANHGKMITPDGDD